MHMGSWCSSLSTYKWRRRSVLCFEVVGRPPAAATTSCTLQIQPLPKHPAAPRSLTDVCCLVVVQRHILRSGHIVLGGALQADRWAGRYVDARTTPHCGGDGGGGSRSQKQGQESIQLSANQAGKTGQGRHCLAGAPGCRQSLRQPLPLRNPAPLPGGARRPKTERSSCGASPVQQHRKGRGVQAQHFNRQFGALGSQASRPCPAQLPGPLMPTPIPPGLCPAAHLVGRQRVEDEVHPGAGQPAAEQPAVAAELQELCAI